MQWNSASEFFNMGGYALYVWGSFGLTTLVMVGEVLAIRARRAELITQLRNEQTFDHNFDRTAP